MAELGDIDAFFDKMIGEDYGESGIPDTLERVEGPGIEEEEEEEVSRAPASIAPPTSVFQERERPGMTDEEKDEEIFSEKADRALEQRDIGILMSDMGAAFDQINRGLAGVSNEEDRKYWLAKKTEAQQRYKGVIDLLKDTRKDKRLNESQKMKKALFNTKMASAKIETNDNDPDGKLATITRKQYKKKTGEDLFYGSMAEYKKVMEVKHLFGRSPMDVSQERVNLEKEKEIVKRAELLAKETGLIGKGSIGEQYATAKDIIENTKGTAIDDFGLIYAMQKAQDFSSAVLDGEIKTVSDARSRAEELQIKISSIFKPGGQLLTDQQRTDILKRIGQKYQDKASIVNSYYHNAKEEYKHRFPKRTGDQADVLLANIKSGIEKYNEDFYKDPFTRQKLGDKLYNPNPDKKEKKRTERKPSSSAPTPDSRRPPGAKRGKYRGKPVWIYPNGGTSPRKAGE